MKLIKDGHTFESDVQEWIDAYKEAGYVEVVDEPVKPKRATKKKTNE